MGIDKLTGSLIDEATREAAEIEKTAQWHVDSMLKEEKSKESGIKDKARAQVNVKLAEQKNERIAWARLEAKRIISEAKEDAISDNIEEFFNSLKDVRKSPQYKLFLAKSVSMASGELGEGLIIHIHKGEVPMLGKIEGNKVVADLEGLGGAIIESADSMVRIDMRLETLFEIKKDSLRKAIYDKVFAKGQE